jgi:hypothetical protein
MLAFMFDPRFKSLKVVENYVGCDTCICLIAEYDANLIILLLMTMFKVLNPIVQGCVVEVVGFVAGFCDSTEEDNNIFCVGTSMEESSCAFVVGDLSLFRRLFISLVTVLIP